MTTITEIETAADAGRAPRSRWLGRTVLAVLVILVVALVGSWWRTGVTGPGHMERVWADDGPPDVQVSGGVDDLVVLSTDRTDVELVFGLVHRGPWPVRIVDVWDTADRDRQPSCGLQATQVEGARVDDWMRNPQGRSVEAFRARLDEVPALRGGEELIVFIDGEGFGPPWCHQTGALITTDTVSVTYRTLGITRRAEVPLPWRFGWSAEPELWPQVTGRGDD